MVHEEQSGRIWEMDDEKAAELEIESMSDGRKKLGLLPW